MGIKPSRLSLLFYLLSLLDIIVLVDVAKLAKLCVSVSAVSMHREDFEIASPVLGIDSTHWQTNPKMHRLVLLSRLDGDIQMPFFLAWTWLLTWVNDSHALVTMGQG